MLRSLFVCVSFFATLGMAILASHKASAAERPISYALEVLPILSDKCFACHGFDAAAREADLRLDQRDGAVADKGGYAAIVPGDPEASEIIVRMLSDDESMRMPPPEAHKEVTPEEIALLKRWIAEGAEYEPHWSFRPLKRPNLPEETASQSSHPIDQFVAARLAEQGLTPSPAADERTLVRRLYLDLLGVPPREAEIEAYLNDTAPGAWQRLVDRLLEDKRYGERMAVVWLDLVRYADTIGYHSDNFMEVSAYRDYVIEAFGQNKPFDQFTIEQLAGDLLPDKTTEQQVASGYNMLLQTTEEGGAQPKEYIAIYAADRVRNVSGVWLGTTMGCAQCHDHKYDPFTMRDFYTMSAFFADIAELAVGPRTPNIKLPTPEEEARMAKLREEIESLREENFLSRDPELAERIKAEQAEWEETTRKSLAAGEQTWLAPEPAKFSANDGIKLKKLADNSILTSGPNPYAAIYEVDLPAKGTVASVRIEFLTDPSFRRYGWLGRHNGTFVLTEVVVELDGKPVSLAAAEADFSQNGFPASHLIDGNDKTGWAIDGARKLENRVVKITLAEPLELGDNEKPLRVYLKHESIYSQHHAGRFKIALAPAPEAPLAAPAALPAQVADIINVPESDRTPQQCKTVAAYYRTLSPILEEARQKSRDLQQHLARIDAGLRTSLTVRALDKPRITRVLPRGNWLDETGEIVEPAFPEFLPAIETDRRLNRLDLARWIVDEENPLTSRTFVNRLWKVFHGRGLSKNLDDLGGQGEPPSHPHLLDWLAVEFRESGWDVKHMVRLIVTSDTYRQTSYASPELARRDPDNRWMARQGRWRLEAEFIRDSALQTAGLLDDSRVGGLSVKPYQPAGYWQHLNFPPREWENSKGADLYRRSLYTFWCRTFLHPSMLAFDAPSREECTAQRSRSNIPQQALVLLNDPIFVEAARGFATRIASQGERDPSERLAWAFEQATCRAATGDELALLTRLYETQLARYREQPGDAQKLIDIGDSPVPEEIDPAELAAWTQVARALLGAYETTSRY